MTTFTTRNVPLAEASDPADIAARINPVAQLQHDRPGVSALTTTQRNALTGAELWDGRLIVNTTTDRLNRYDLGTTTWIVVPDNADIGALLATTGVPAQDSVTASRGVSSSAARADHVHQEVVWTSYGPTYNYVLGTGGSLIGRYAVHGKTCTFWAKLILGSGFTLGAAPTLTLPFTARTQANLDITTEVNFLDAGTTNYRGCGVIFSGATTVSAWVLGTNGAFQSVTYTLPFTWVAGDAITFNGTYEIA